MIPGRPILVVLVVFLVSVCDGGLLEHITHVKIINGLGNGQDLSVHCQSRNGDLGIHVIPPLSSYEFSFRDDFFWGTLFFCRFWWSGEPSHWFDIYVPRRDEVRCGQHCTWLVTPLGPCLYDGRVRKFSLCAKWSDQKKPVIGITSDQKLYGHVN